MKKMKLFVVIIMVATVFFACNQTAKKSESKFVLNGTLEGVTNEIIELSENGKKKRDTVVIENGKFTFSGDYANSTRLFLTFQNQHTSFYAENCTMTLTGNAKNFAKATISGGKAQEDYKKYKRDEAEALKAYNVKELKKVSRDRKASTEDRIKARNALVEFSKKSAGFENIFIKENPASLYTLELICHKPPGQGVEEIEAMLNALDASLSTNPKVVELRKRVEEWKRTEVSFDKFVKDASNITYKVDKKFNGKNLTGIIYLGMFKNNNICGLKVEGTVNIINPAGKLVSSFNTNIDGKPSSIAVDNSDNIYVLAAKMEEQVKKVRGKKVTRMVPKGVECTIFNNKGQKQSSFELAGLVSAAGARVVDNKLMVSDCRNSLIGIFDAKTGKMSSKIEDMRSCCGILDFSINGNKEILVANLGAFKVQGFDFTGKQLLSFGQRDKSLNDFHGCCNPVSVAYLSNGAIVTVEKSPTRIKIYSKEGAKKIEGIQELVKGCSYIPMIVDGKDNLYLASLKKGMLKCISTN